MKREMSKSKINLNVYVLIFSILVMTNITCHAQDMIVNNPNETLKEYAVLRDQLKIVQNQEGNQRKLVKVEGSPYWNDEFVSGYIIRDGHDKVEVVLNYNVAKEQIEIQIPGDKENFIVKRSNELEFLVQPYHYVYKRIKTAEDDYVQGYFLQYELGEIVFLVKPKVEIVPEAIPETSYGKTKPAHYKKDEDYFLSVHDELFSEFKLKNRHLKKLFKGEVQVLKYLKDHRVKTEEDMVDFIKFYSALDS